MRKPDHRDANLRTANLLGALSLVMMDGMKAELGALTEIGESDWAALIVLEHMPETTVDHLARIVRLSQPGAVRLVDRLEAAGWVERRQGSDRRARPLVLTGAGHRMVRALLLGRERTLRQPLDVLDDGERETLTRLLEKMLAGLGKTEDEADTACRLCDESVCPEATCPLTQGCRAAAS